MANPLPSGLFYRIDMREITSQELIIRMKSEPDLIIIDVREEWEFIEDNIGAKCYPLGELPQFLNELSDLKNREIIVHCKTGARAGRAQKYLTKQGFTQVVNLIGGIEAYRALQPA